jgi:hypothetical protein
LDLAERYLDAPAETDEEERAMLALTSGVYAEGEGIDPYDVVREVEVSRRAVLHPAPVKYRCKGWGPVDGEYLEVVENVEALTPEKAAEAFFEMAFDRTPEAWAAITSETTDVTVIAPEGHKFLVGLTLHHLVSPEATGSRRIDRAGLSDEDKRKQVLLMDNGLAAEGWVEVQRDDNPDDGAEPAFDSDEEAAAFVDPDFTYDDDYEGLVLIHREVAVRVFGEENVP